MRPFDVYGIGNALVDIDFEVSEETLARLNITKSVMTLIDEVTHHRLLIELDGIKHLKACGGSAANTLFTIQQLGAQTFYSCKIGADDAGEFFYREMRSHGVETNLHECEREGVTGKCIVLVTPDADRTMNTYLGATANFSKAQICESALSQSQYLYIEGYLVASVTGREAAIYARKMAYQHQIKTAISLSDPNMVTFFKEGLLEIIDSKVDILFCNDREALLFTDSNDLAAARELLKNHAHTFVITQGGEGSLIYDGQDYIQIPAYEVPVVDTVGAGDVFAGTFLYAVTQGHSYRDAGNSANYAASKVVSKFGPRLNQEEIKDVKATTFYQQAV